MEPRMLPAYLSGSAMRRNLHELSVSIHMRPSIDESNRTVVLNKESTPLIPKDDSLKNKKAKKKSSEKNKEAPLMKGRDSSSTKISDGEKPNNQSTPSSSYPELTTRRKETGKPTRTGASEKTRKSAQDTLVEKQSALNSTSTASERKITGKKALSRQMSPEAREKAQVQMICDAIQSGPDKLQVLIELGIDLNVRDKNGDTPLKLACDGAQAECVQLLIEGGAALPDNEQGRVELLGTLMLMLYRKVNFQKAPQMLLMDETAAPAIRSLVNRCKNLNFFEPLGRYTPLTLACECRDTSMIALLIEHGASRHSADGRNMTPMSKIGINYVFFEHMADTFRALLKDAPNAKELVNQVDDKGLPPILQIAIRFDTTANKTLSRSGIPHREGMHGHVTEAVEVLLNAGADIAATDSEKRRVLYHAYFNLNAPLVRLLYQHGATTNHLSQQQWSDIKERIRSATQETDGPFDYDWFKDHLKAL